MGNKADKIKIKKERKIAWAVVIAINVIIAAVASVASVNYFLSQNNYRYDMAEQSFSSTMSSMSQVAYGYLHTEQTFCDNWAVYINQRYGEMNMEIAAEFVRNVNTNKSITTHIIYYDTLEGVVINEKGVSNISYKGLESQVSNAFDKARNCHTESSHLHITSPYKDPVSGVTSVSFCHDLKLVNSDGEEKRAVLLRVIPISQFTGQWVFPTGYEKAKIALIDGDGEFIVRFDGIEQSNFFDYINTYNNIDAKELTDMKMNIANLDGGDMRYMNKGGQDSCYSFKRLGA